MKKVVYTAGIWDLFHIGHLNILKNSKALGNYLIVGVLTDHGAQLYKRKPIIPLDERIAIVRSIRYVDEVCIQKTTDPTINLKRIKPHIMTHGSDWDRLLEGHETLERLNIQFKTLPYTKTVSTTFLLETIKNT